jgi:acyl-CoA synthetase (NDP forming)
MSRQENLARLINPRHIAFIGGADAAYALRTCQALGYRGEVWCVNPKHDEVEGVVCYPSVDALPAAPDAAYVAVRGDLTIDVVHSLAGRGAGGAICYAAGFAEMGGIGVERQTRLVEAAGDSMAVIGPNCYGVLNLVDGVGMWAGPLTIGRAERGVALVSQSGALSETMTFGERSAPFAYLVSVGNQAMIGIEDVLAVYVELPGITAIGIYVEGLRDVAAFSRAAVRALERGIPIIAIKTGRSAAAGRVALGHTSSLTGSDALYDALFHRLGIIRVDSVTELVELAKFVTFAGIPEGRRFSAVAASGGDMAMTADYADRLGLELPPLSQAQVAAIKAELPPYANVANPLDYTIGVWGKPEVQRRVFTTMASGDVDTAIMVMEYAPAGQGHDEACHGAVDGMIAAHEDTGKPVFVTSHMPEDLPESARKRMIAGGIAPLQGFPDAMRALAGAAWYGERRRAWRADRAGADPSLFPTVTVPGALRLLTEWEAKQRLAAKGLRVPEGRLVTAAEAPAAAAEVGFPVAVKAGGTALAHKTEAGAVALGLADCEAVATAAQRIAAAVPEAARLMLVERMAPEPVAELIVGVTRDPLFGPSLVIGAGGILVELIDDSRTILLPTTRAKVEEALGSLKVAKLLDGYRGRPRGDRAAAIDAILAVAAFATAHHDRLHELDVNPLLVLPEGEGAIAVDALISMVT